MPDVKPVLSQDETIALLLERSKRPKLAVPIRHTFIQQGTQRRPEPGPLSALVRQRDERGLELFLLTRAVASGGEFDVTEWATTWARTIGIFDETVGRTAVSRAWRRLEKLALIQRQRGLGGRTRITILKEDGSGEPYDHPHARTERYFQLPFEYWATDTRWHTRLSFPAKAMLLIGLSLMTDEFSLPQERVPDWYGISADTAGRGLRELSQSGILMVVREELIPSLQSKTGYAARHVYRFNAPFDLKRRGLGRKVVSI